MGSVLSKLCLLGSLVVSSVQAWAQEARVFHQTMFSTAMGSKQWGYNVYLPPSYDSSDKRYPVLYVLHGGNSDEHGMTFVARNYVHSLILSGQIPELILVFPNGGRDHFFLDKLVIRNQLENPDTHIVRELIPHIDATFRTVADRRARAIAGFSMGGYGAYHFATKYPELFSAAGALAAGGPYGPNGLIVNYSPAEKPQALAVSNAAALRTQCRFVVAVGGRDLVDYNNEMVGILRGQSIAHEYHVLPNVGHDLGAILNQVGSRIFQYLTAGFSAPTMDAARGEHPPSRDDVLATALASPAAVAAHDRARWLDLFTPGATVEDPVGTKSHVHHAGESTELVAFYETFIAPTDIRFEATADFVSDQRVLRDVVIATRFAGGCELEVPAFVQYDVTRLGPDLKLTSLRAFWEMKAMTGSILRQGGACLTASLSLSRRLLEHFGAQGTLSYLAGANSGVGRSGKRRAAALVEALDQRDQATLKRLLAKDAVVACPQAAAALRAPSAPRDLRWQLGDKMISAGLETVLRITVLGEEGPSHGILQLAFEPGSERIRSLRCLF